MIGTSYSEMQAVIAFLNWQNVHWSVDEDKIRVMKETMGRHFFMIEIEPDVYLFSFNELYKYFQDNGLMLC